MSFSLTLYAQKVFGDSFWQQMTFPTPADFWLSLHTADPTDSGSLAAELTMIASNYARQPLLAKMGPTNLSTGISQNTTVITTLPSLIDQGIVTHIGISDAATAGNMWMFGALTTAQLMSVGRSFQLVPGLLQLRFD